VPAGERSEEPVSEVAWRKTRCQNDRATEVVGAKGFEPFASKLREDARRRWDPRRRLSVKKSSVSRAVARLEQGGARLFLRTTRRVASFGRDPSGNPSSYRGEHELDDDGGAGATESGSFVAIRSGRYTGRAPHVRPEGMRCPIKTGGRR
jgi:hypothetical protein